MTEPLVLNDLEVPPGERVTMRIPVARRYTSGEVSIPVCVVHGRKPGPRLFVSAALHGDEINGIEIIRRVLRSPSLKRLAGALIAVPVVNVYGFVAHTRYLPDRRDLNRCFPGTASGSLAGRLAHTFMQEVVSKATHGIDLHTGAIHRTNLPQIRAALDQSATARMAEIFGAPVILDAALREGSLRAAVHARGIPIVVYEAGEALRFDEVAIRAGQRGILAVMRDLGMLPPSTKKQAPIQPFVAHGSTWVRAPESGILNTRLRLGARVRAGQVLGEISDPLGEEEAPVLAPTDGVLIGRTNLPLANEGDALFHLGVFERLGPVAETLDQFQEEMDPTTT